MLTKSRSAKAAVAAAILLLSAGTAAAAGALPGAAQDAASAALEKVGVSVPGANSHSNGHADSRGKSADDHTSSDAGDDTNGTDGGAPEATTPETGPNAHAEFGLCTAFEASGERAHNQHENFPFNCGSDDTHGKPADPGSRGRDHQPASAPEDQSGNAPEAPPADDPSDDAAQTGTDTAGEHDGGASAPGAAASSAGAGNRGDHGRP